MANESDKDKLREMADRIAKAEDAIHPERREKSDDAQAARLRAKYVRITTDFIATILGALGLGWFVDQQFGIAPWAMIGFLVGGTVTAFWTLVAAVTSLPKGTETPLDMDENEKQSPPEMHNGDDLTDQG